MPLQSHVPDSMTDLFTPTPDPKPLTIPQARERCAPEALARMLATSRILHTELLTLMVTPAARALFQAVLEYAVLHSVHP